MIFDFPSKFFCLTVPNIFIAEPFSVSLISGTEKVWIRGGRGYQDFPPKFSCLTVPKNCVGESLTVALISGIEKVWMREGGVSRISVENFLSHSAENFRSGEPFSVSLTSGIKKFYASVAYVMIFDFLSNFFCPTVPNDFVGEPFSV